MDEVIQRLRDAGETVIPGDEAFRLWGTYGFPVDITRDVAQEQGFSVDEAGFQAALAEDRAKSKASAIAHLPADLSVYGQLLQALQDKGNLDENGVRSLIYESAADVDTKVIGLVVDGASVAAASAGQRVEIVLPQTPFYVESGGQVSDSGDIYYFPEDLDEPVWAVRVDDTRRPIAGLIVHIGEVVSGTVQVGDPAYAVIDTERRWDIMRNHTATHVLHRELRARLGEHVHQAGSLVAPDRLRFDFTHTAAISSQELADI